MEIQIYPKRGARKVVAAPSATGVVPKQTDIGRIVDSVLGLETGATDEFATVPNPFEGTAVDPYAKQVLAGAAELPYYSGMVYGLAGLGYDAGVDWLGEQVGIEDAGRMPPGAAEMFELAQHGSQQANEAFNTGAPTDIGETLARALPNLIGGPIGATPKALGKAAARDALEVITPFTVATAGRYPAQATANVAVGTVAGDVLGDVFDPNYASILDQIHGFGTDDAAFSTDGTPLSSLPLVDAATHDMIRTDLDPQAAKINQITRTVSDDIEDDSIRDDALLISAMALFGGRRAKKYLSSMEQTKPATRVTSIPTNLEASIFDQQAPILEWYRKNNPQKASFMKAMADTHANHLIARQSEEHLMLTGEFPTPLTVQGQQFKIPSPRRYLDVVRQVLKSPDRLQNFNDYIRLKDESGNRSLLLIEKGIVGQVYHPSISTTDALARIAQYERDPEIVKLYQGYRQIIDGVWEYAYRRGKISQQAYQDTRDRFPFYTPRIEPAQPDIVDNIVDKTLYAESHSRETEQSFFQKRVIEQAAPGTKESSASPTAVLEAYIKGVVRETEANDFKRRFANDVIALERTGKRMEQLGMRHSKVPSNDRSNDISYERNGERNYLVVEDRALRIALGDRPIAYNPILNNMRRMQQMFTTGYGNPLRSLTTALYDVTLGPALAQKGVKSGYIDLPVGFVNYMRAGLAREFSHMLNTKVWKDKVTGRTGMLATMMGGPANMRRAADYMGKVYANSTLSLYENLAAGHGRYHGGFNPGSREDIVGILAGQTMGAASRPTETMRRVATLVFDALHNGQKIEALRRSKTPNMSRDDLTTLAGKVRDLTGDPMKSGSARGIQMLTSSITYGNIYLQTWRQIVRQAHQRPWRLASNAALVSSAAFALAWYNSRDPEKRAHFWGLQTPGKRGMGPILYPEGGPVEAYSEIHVDPMMRSAWALGTHAANMLLGLSDGRFMNDPALVQAMEEYVDMVMYTEPGTTREEALRQGNMEMRNSLLAADMKAAGNSALDPGLPIPFQLYGDITGQRFSSSPLEVAEDKWGYEKKRELLTGQGSERTPGEIAPAWAADIWDTLLGITGTAMYTMADGFNRSTTAGWSDKKALSQNFDELMYGMTGKQAPAGNTLFGYVVPTSTASAEAVEAKGKLAAIDKIVERMNKTQRGAGVTSLGQPEDLGAWEPQALYYQFLDEMDQSIPLDVRKRKADFLIMAVTDVMAFKNAMASGPLKEAQQENDKLESKRIDASLSPRNRAAETSIIAARIDKLYAEILIKTMTLEQKINWVLRENDPDAEEVTLETLLP